jgi:prevent-host-death family protein
MKTMSADDAKNAFGLMIDTALVEPVLIKKHGRGVVMVISAEGYERPSEHLGVCEDVKRAKGAGKGGE